MKEGIVIGGEGREVERDIERERERVREKGKERKMDRGRGSGIVAKCLYILDHKLS